MSETWGHAAARQQRMMTPLAIAIVILLLAGLPLALWLDLRNLSEQTLRRQAEDIGHVLDDVRNFYANEVVGRILGTNAPATASHNYRSQAGAIPIPATFSIELGRIIGTRDNALAYRFVSDFPFNGREPHRLDRFERDAIETLRREPTAAPISETFGSVFDRTVRVATPVIMGQACVNCHATHPDSPKRDWKVGDVRGLQVITAGQSINAGIFAFKYLLIYFAMAVVLGGLFIWMQKRQASLVAKLNAELTAANDFLAGISMKISKYLSPQIYKSIFSGQRDVTIATERKKLSIFFSDIKDFTATTERMQPEDLTALLNEYLTEMSTIALAHGGTVDKFIGDAILVFFGDPETKGVEEDARSCLRMAVEMQKRLVELNSQWRARGIELPFRARMGINTGYCNVGNFGSSDRMDYTIIGAEANLAARLQSIGEPGKIVLSYETYALVANMVHARAMDPISMKGISREVVPYVVDEVVSGAPKQPKVISERAKGLNLFLDLDGLDRSAVQNIRKVLQDALNALGDSREATSPR
jgi:adenylate cyclase